MSSDASSAPGEREPVDDRSTQLSVSGSDDHVLAAQRLGATVDGEERFFDVSSVMRFSDGKQKERWLHIHDQSAFDEFMSRF